MPFAHLNCSSKAAYLPLTSPASCSATLLLRETRHTTGKRTLELFLVPMCTISEDGAWELDSIGWES